MKNVEKLELGEGLGAIKNLARCPKTNCKYAFEFDSAERDRTDLSKCPVDGVDFCRRCSKSPYHYGVRCDEVDAISDEYNRYVLDYIMYYIYIYYHYSHN
jgi:hypothetical protein